MLDVGNGSVPRQVLRFRRFRSTTPLHDNSPAAHDEGHEKCTTKMMKMLRLLARRVLFLLVYVTYWSGRALPDGADELVASIFLKKKVNAITILAS